MFSYIDPTIRARLIETGQLRQINAQGELLEGDAAVPPGENALNVLGKVPLPIDVGGRRVVFDWYAFVRRTELAHTEEMAAAVRARGGKQLFTLI